MVKNITLFSIVTFITLIITQKVISIWTVPKTKTINLTQKEYYFLYDLKIKFLFQKVDVSNFVTNFVN